MNGSRFGYHKNKSTFLPKKRSNDVVVKNLLGHEAVASGAE